MALSESNRRRRPAAPGATAAALYKDAYEEGKRAVVDQVAELDSMRQRSVQFVAFVGSATAFLVGTGLAGASGVERSGVFFALAGVASLISLLTIAALIAVLLGLTLRDGRLQRARWNLTNSAKVLVEDWLDPDVGSVDDATFYRRLALVYDQKATENDPLLRTVRRSYLVLLVAGAVQIVGWAAVVWMFA